MTKRSLLALCVAAAALCISSAVAHVTDAITATWRRTRDWCSGLADLLLAKITPAKPQFLIAPRVALLGAIQFLGRLMRRDRPVVSTRWRMCPST